LFISSACAAGVRPIANTAALHAIRQVRIRSPPYDFYAPSQIRCRLCACEATSAISFVQSTPLALPPDRSRARLSAEPLA
jgi:hypothetical protein